MYSTLPPVIAELIANSYDADANLVEIFLNDNEAEKTILIRDDGHGMSFDDINTKFLKIGRKKRKEGGTYKSESGNRDVIGRKGLGKLSFFGIASKATITTRRDGVENTFSLDIEKILESTEKKYQPDIIGERNLATEQTAGTSVLLMSMPRKTPFVPTDIALSLSRSFEIFDENDFEVYLIHNGDQEAKIKVTNALKYEDLEKEHEWNFPNDAFTFGYEYANQISGRVISLKQGETVPSDIESVSKVVEIGVSILVGRCCLNPFFRDGYSVV